MKSIAERLKRLENNMEVCRDTGTDEEHKEALEALKEAIALMDKPGRVEVETVFGKLFAQVDSDPNYPGIDICIEQEDNDGKYHKQLALAECTPNHPVDGGHALRLLVWNSDSEDYTDDFTFFEERSEDELPETIWRRYLQYLNEWIGSHCGPGFYGMTPACFQEWLGCEYKHLIEDEQRENRTHD